VRIRGRPASGPFTSAERTLITGPVLAASLLHAVNMSTAYVALPSMQGNLSAAPDQVAWVITAFVLATAVGTILTSWFGQRLGRRRVFLASILGFTVTSLMCAFAGSLTQLVVYRALQGFVSAPLLPISQAIMLDTYPRERHGFAMSIWSMGMILGPVVGPTLGAFLTEWYGWRYLFFMNIPLGIIAFVSVVLTLPEAEIGRRRLDWIGVISLVVCVVCVQLIVDRGEREGWFESAEIITEAAIGAMAFWVFLTHSLTTDSPYINFAVFRDRNYAVGLALIFCFGIAVFSSLFILPLFLQNIQGYPVLSAGWVVSSRGIGTAAAMLTAGMLADRVPVKYLIMLGLGCVCISNYWMTLWNAGVSMGDVVSLTAVNGFGMGLMWVSLTTVTFSTLAPAFRTEAAALFALVRSIGASIGTSVVVSILVRSSQISYIELRDNISRLNNTLPSAELRTLWDPGTAAGSSGLRDMVLKEAQMIAFLNDFNFLVLVTLAAMPLVLLLRRPKKRAG
jgi:MFS transporter, DHA2 family, multidrug resistance protein